MAHFARCSKATDEVIQVHAVNNSDCEGTTGESDAGINYLMEVHANQPWINDIYFVQTSFNGKIRKRFAGIGMIYSKQYDAFITKKPTSNMFTMQGVELKGEWVFNEKTCDWDFKEQE